MLFFTLLLPGMNPFSPMHLAQMSDGTSGNFRSPDTASRGSSPIYWRQRNFTSDRRPLSPPHKHQHVIGYYSRGTQEHVQMAIDAALKAQYEWENTSWEHRAAIFLKAADLISGPYRAQMNAATMLAQSKSVFQAEIDAVAELIDFLRFNVHYMEQIYRDQPNSAPGIWNRLEYRPLRRLCFLYNALQLYGYCRQLTRLTGHDGQYLCMEARR